jgi:NADH dehydrogenase FAD-containing subunit
LIAGLDLGRDGDVFADVDPLTMRSNKYENLYVLGDAARTPYGKSAYAASVCAQLCANEIARQIGIKMDPVRSTVSVACFPYVTPEQAMIMRVNYEIERDSDGIHLTSNGEVWSPSAENAETRWNWERSTLKETFG